MTGRLMLLDTASLYYRAFHGLPDTIRAPDGSPVNAIRGLLDMVARLLTDFEPTELVACWDDNWRPHWRVALVPGYKAHRVATMTSGANDVEQTPELLVPQIPIIREVLGALGIPIIGAQDYEADDVIGTLATRARLPVDIVTGDRDLFQLVDDTSGVRIIYTARGMSKLELITDAVVVSKYGVVPGQYADFAVLRGDPSDGLPGVPGVGEKTAAALLAEFGTLGRITEAAQDPTTPLSASVRSKIIASSAYLQVAPRVVAVARDLDLGAVDARIHTVDDVRRQELELLSEKWGLRGSLERAVRAVGSVD
ncbi:5'-3' exonuclease [Arthrobacter sp. H14-L1]|uniref:5'-3' exonuclease n=1 Tax=Arthrobacter sp. H14-L1 TaxID=2996697 RepID=UPI002270019E|nr:5'-3' exonuclease [Arthrobacter sp. H14-L1]MCY0905161.1 5'-3' exonuclease [Arthrobacter sp. H14-L1]